METGKQDGLAYKRKKQESKIFHKLKKRKENQRSYGKVENENNKTNNINRLLFEDW